MKSKKYTPLALLSCLVPALCQAADSLEIQPEVTLDEVVVTAGRIAQPLKEQTISMTVISEQEIAISPARNVGELLAEKGVGSIKKYPGALTAVGIRGFKTATHGNDLKGHVLILLNGRRAGTGNLSKIITKNVERVEIIRGPGAVQYGSAAMGGVVNVITRKGSTTPSAQLQSRLGSYGYDENSIMASGAQENFDMSASFSRSSMDDYDTGDGERFYNSGFDHIDSYSVNAGYTFRDTQRIGVIYNRYYADKIGSPGYLSSNDLDNTKDSANHSIDLIYDGTSADRRHSWQLRSFSGRDKDSWFDPTASNASGWDNNIPARSRTEQDGAQAQLSMDFTTMSLTAGVDWLKYEIKNTWNPTRTEYENSAAFLLAKAKFMQERLIIDGGLRYDAFDVEVIEPAGNDEDDTNITSHVGLAWLVSDTLKLRAHYGEAFIMPGADELAADYFSTWGTHYVGNPELKPESSRTYEAGIDFSTNEITANVAYFYTRFKDKIESVASGADQSWDNVGRAELSGFEGEFSWDIGARFDWPWEVRPYANFVYLDRLEDSENDEDLKYISDWNGSVGLLATDYEGFSARFNVSYSGEQTIEDWESGAFPAPVIKKGGFVVADFSLSKKIVDLHTYGSFTLAGEVTNLFDRDYAYVKGYPMPGRSVFVTLTYDY